MMRGGGGGAGRETIGAKSEKASRSFLSIAAAALQERLWSAGGGRESIKSFGSDSRLVTIVISHAARIPIGCSLA